MGISNFCKGENYIYTACNQSFLDPTKTTSGWGKILNAEIIH